MISTNKNIQDFQFKQFAIAQDRCPMKVGTDGILLGAWASTDNAQHVLDIGTGTGLIAIMLAQRTNTNVAIDAVEIDDISCVQAQENMTNSPWSSRLRAYPSPIQEYAKKTDQKYDLIVSNPPFFTGGTISENQKRSSVRHTIKLPHGDLLRAVRNLLSETGQFALILPYLEGLRFQELALGYNLHCTRLTEVKPKRNKSTERLLMEFSRTGKVFEKEELIIQKEEANDWTTNFRNLTGAFYL